MCLVKSLTEQYTKLNGISMGEKNTLSQNPSNTLYIIYMHVFYFTHVLVYIMDVYVGI